MTEVEFSMDPKWVPLMELGDKRATTRTKRKCNVADTFTINGQRYVITRIVRKPLWSAANLYYQTEGFRTEEEYKDAIRAYYPDIQEGDDVWVHFFVKVDPIGEGVSQ